MAASDAVPVLIGAAIGAGGAVLAQITAQVFSGRRDTRRLGWEQDRQDREWEIRRAERFLDLKRELYSAYLTQADEFVSFISRADDPPGLPRPELPDPGEIRRLRANIRLIAPRDVYLKVDMAALGLIGAVWTLSSASTDPDREEGRKQGAEARQALTAAERAMRADLRGEEEGYFGGRPGPKVPPDPPPGRLMQRWRRTGPRPLGR